ncbi:MAG: hypothetical protein WAK48_18565 [Candidatus Acidiferrum sp.]|jgi:hypothetical protein
MKRFRLLLLVLLAATASLASARDWKPARVVNDSETDVTGEMRAEKITMHYTIETEDMVYFVDYSFKPGQKNSRPPSITANVETKIAIEGKHAYILDATGQELKMHIVKKTAKH